MGYRRSAMIVAAGLLPVGLFVAVSSNADEPQPSSPVAEPVATSDQDILSAIGTDIDATLEEVLPARYAGIAIGWTDEVARAVISVKDASIEDLELLRSTYPSISERIEVLSVPHSRRELLGWLPIVGDYMRSQFEDSYGYEVHGASGTLRLHVPDEDPGPHRAALEARGIPATALSFSSHFSAVRTL
ncbi:MAG: hypothetical protein ACLGH3_10560 [Actinomycetota bacterium]